MTVASINPDLTNNKLTNSTSTFLDQRVPKQHHADFDLRNVVGTKSNTKCCLKDHEFIVPSTPAKATYSWYLLGHLV